MITISKWRQLKKHMSELDIDEKDIVEKFILGSGAGGQKIQKTHSCVYLKHIPTGTEVKCQLTRMREDNRFHARRLLCDKIEEQIKGEKSKRQQEIEKIRRQKRKRSKRAQEKVLESKHKRAELKKLRKPPKEEDP